jgi:Universal stress protein family
VIGSHGHGHMFEAVLGSVARYCVHNASCPVVVIPARLAEPAAAAVVTDEQAGQPLSYGLGPLL